MEEKDRMNRGILLTGASGFIGGAVLARLRRLPECRLRVLIHRNDLPSGGPVHIEIVKADLSSPASLDGICRDIKTVIHAASYIGDDAEQCQTVNARGTEELAARARAAGVGRFLYLSNTAVYGFGVHRGVTEAEAAIRPATAISRSRVRAENAVLAAGGTILRPTFVYGRGDRHFLPALIRALDRFPFLINGGRARLSVISAEELAEAIAALVSGAEKETNRGTFHVNDGRPVSFKNIVEALARTTGTRRPRRSLPYPIARMVMGLAAGRIFDKAGRRSAAHRLFLVSRDHFYSSEKLRREVSWPVGPPFELGLTLCADWYRSFRRPRAREA